MITEKGGSRLHNNMVNNIFQDGRNSGQKNGKTSGVTLVNPPHY